MAAAEAGAVLAVAPRAAVTSAPGTSGRTAAAAVEEVRGCFEECFSKLVPSLDNARCKGGACR